MPAMGRRLHPTLLPVSTSYNRFKMYISVRRALLLLLLPPPLLLMQDHVSG
jgi:hypothetical protein